MSSPITIQPFRPLPAPLPDNSHFKSKPPKLGEQRVVELHNRELRYVGFQDGGIALLTHIRQMQRYDGKSWVTESLLASGLDKYSKTPMIAAQQRRRPDHPQFGYLVGRSGKVLVIQDKHGRLITDPEQGRIRVQEMLKYGGLTTTTDRQVQTAHDMGRLVEAGRNENRYNGTGRPAQLLGAGAGGRALPLFLEKNSQLPTIRQASDYLPRMQYALARAAEWAGSEMAAQLRALASAEGAAMLVAVAGLSATPAGPGVAAALIALGGINFAHGVIQLVEGVMQGKDVMALNEAGRAFARGLSGGVIDVALGGMMQLTGTKVSGLKVAFTAGQRRQIRQALDSDPYEILRRHRIPTTLNSRQVMAAHDMTMKQLMLNTPAGGSAGKAGGRGFNQKPDNNKPQRWYPRTNDPIQWLDQVRLQRTSIPRTSPYEDRLGGILERAGYKVYPQFAFRDMDGSNIFTWHADMLVVASNGKAIVVEVDGKSHLSPFQREQDRRKEQLLWVLYGLRTVRIKNSDVGFHREVVQKINKAVRMRHEPQF